MAELEKVIKGLECCTGAVEGVRQMHIYRYGTLMSPPGPGAVPRKGLIQTIGRHFNAPSGHFCWGLAEYGRPLTDEEISEYELEFITDYTMEDTDEH